jgi:hypothetical protein
VVTEDEATIVDVVAVPEEDAPEEADAEGDEG